MLLFSQVISVGRENDASFLFHPTKLQENFATELFLFTGHCDFLARPLCGNSIQNKTARSTSCFLHCLNLFHTRRRDDECWLDADIFSESAAVSQLGAKEEGGI